MIAACPKCGARYRIEDGRLPPQGARLRCARCEAIFKVIAPARARPGPASRKGAGPSPAAQAPAAPRVRETPVPSRPGDGERDLVLVADPEAESGRATVTALESWGLRVLLVHDGVEAILSIQRSLPRAVVLDAALPKMFGFQICELMKRNESLRHIRVVLVAAIHDRERYRRPPSELYGADAYVERPRLAEQLRAVLRDLGLRLREPEAAAPAAPTARAEPARPAASQTPQGPEPAARAQGAAAARSPEGPDPAEVAKAERLARIVVSDIVLYNAEKFEAGVAAGNVLEALRDELEEGRSLFRQRIDAGVRDARDYLVEEMLRVARRRGMA